MSDDDMLLLEEDQQFVECRFVGTASNVEVVRLPWQIRLALALLAVVLWVSFCYWAEFDDFAAAVGSVYLLWRWFYRTL